MKRTIYLVSAIMVFGACTKEKQVGNATPLKVEISDVKSVKTTGNLHYSGTIEASQTIPLTFQTAATVEQVLVNAGDEVRKGQLLAIVDKTDAQNMLDISISKHQQALDAYNRLKEVHDNGSLSEIKWVEMQTNLQQAQSSVSLSKSNLKKCMMYAPESGVIGRRNIEPGMSSLGGANAPLELVKIECVFVKITVPENEINQIKKGQKASFRVSALGGQTFEGTVSNVGIVANQVSRTYEVKILVTNTEHLLKPGMVCDVNLNITVNKEIIAIPYQSVDKDENNNPFVYVIDPATNIAKKRTVSIGDYESNNQIEVYSGLKVGEKVVCDGKQKISDNCKVIL